LQDSSDMFTTDTNENKTRSLHPSSDITTNNSNEHSTSSQVVQTSLPTTHTDNLNIVTDIHSHSELCPLTDITHITHTSLAPTNCLTTTEVTDDTSNLAHSCITSHSTTHDMHLLHTSPSTNINISHDLSLSGTSSTPFAQQWTCSPEEEDFMKSFDATEFQPKQKPSRKTSTPVRHPYIYVKTNSIPSHSRPSSTHSDTPTPTRNTKSHNPIDNLQMKVDCLIEKVQHGVHWATTYISHNDSHSAIEELSSLRDSILKSRTSIHQQCAQLRLQMTHKSSTSS